MSPLRKPLALLTLAVTSVQAPLANAQPDPSGITIVDNQKSSVIRSGRLTGSDSEGWNLHLGKPIDASAYNSIVLDIGGSRGFAAKGDKGDASLKIRLNSDDARPATVQIKPLTIERGHRVAVPLKESGAIDPRRITGVGVELPSVAGLQLKSIRFENWLRPRVKSDLKRGNQALLAGNTDEAAKIFDQIFHQVGDDKDARRYVEISQAKLMSVNALQMTGEKREHALKNVEKNYRRIIDASNQQPVLKARASNDLSVFFLNCGQDAKAVAELTKVKADIAAWESARFRATVSHNLGVALSNMERPQEAFKEFKLAVETDPTFTPAIEGAFRTLQKSEDGDNKSKLAAEVADQVFAAAERKPPGEVDTLTVAREVRESLRKWGDRDDATPLHTSLLRYYVSSQMSRTTFLRFENKRLQELQTKHREIARFRKDLVMLYDAALPLFEGDELSRWYLPDGDWKKRFSGLTGHIEQLRVCSELWAEVARSYEIAPGEIRQLDQAMARYLMALLFDAANTKAATSAASLARTWPEQRGFRITIARWINRRLFDERADFSASPALQTHRVSFS